MNDAISRSAVLDQLQDYLLQETCGINRDVSDVGVGLEIALNTVKGAPALDVAPVVHAHWIKTFGSDGFVSTLRCSKCNSAENSTYIPGNFCWFCGAKMDGEADA